MFEENEMFQKIMKIVKRDYGRYPTHRARKAVRAILQSNNGYIIEDYTDCATINALLKLELTYGIAKSYGKPLRYTFTDSVWNEIRPNLNTEIFS